MKGDERFEIPPSDPTSKLYVDVVSSLEDAMEKWEKQMSLAIEEQLKRVPPGNGPLAEIDFWRERSAALSALSEPEL